MKLNIGCGKKFDPNYYNLDLYDDLVADKKMSALNLKFSDNSCQEVKAIHIIEHLGFYQSIYALSEFFRVLEPEGLLILETPDLERTFRIYLNSNYEQKKDTLIWIYGLPHQGLQHKFCFPPQLLMDILEKTGFENIVQTEFYNEESIPTIRIVCNKTTNERFLEILQIFASIRKRLLSEKVVDFNNFFLTKEQEDLLNFLLISMIEALGKEDGSKKFEFIKKALISSPQIVKYFLIEMANSRIFSKFNVNYVIEITELLIKLKFPLILFEALMKAPIMPGSQKIVFFSIESFGLSMINKILYNKAGKNGMINDLKQKSINLRYQGLTFFSLMILKRASLDFFYQGIKEFYQQDYLKSLNKLLDAIKLYRDDFLYYWNAAKAYAKLNLQQKAIRFYKRTLKLLNITNLKNKGQIKKDIKVELESIRKPMLKLIEIEPVLSLDKYQ
jgi:predicted SAM-dependent methyltransferase